MASPRYTLNIPDDNTPPEKHEMTAAEKRSNFWFYHKVHIIAIAIGTLLIGSFIYELATKVTPDYTVGIVSPYTLPDDARSALEAQLTTFADDRNGDGKTVLVLSEFNFAPESDTTMVDPNIHAANVTRLMGDIQLGESMLFFAYDLEYAQQNYDIFAYNDGTMPAEGVRPDYSKMGVKWTDCPPLTALDLGRITRFDGSDGGAAQDLFSDFYLVKRAYKGTAIEGKKGMDAYYESSMTLFDKLTQQ